MKTILIMRHAKSDWSDGSLADFDRPLNKRGKKAAPFMGIEIKKRDLVPDIIISSPAKRAKMTAKAVAENCGFDEDIIWNEDFYFGYMNDIINSVRDLPDRVNSVMVVGHNPTWESMVNILSRSDVSMTTANISVLELDSDNWKDLQEGKCTLKLHLQPKQLM